MNFTFDTTTIILIILFLIILVLAWMVFQLHSKLQKFLVGSSSNLPDSLSTMDNSIVNLESFKKEIEAYLATVEKRLRRSTQGIHTVRFNPFKGSTGSGGNQSFATAFINEHGDGVVISSLYAREHVSIFAKPIKNGTSEYELSEEENEAIREALKIVK